MAIIARARQGTGHDGFSSTVACPAPDWARPQVAIAPCAINLDKQALSPEADRPGKALLETVADLCQGRTLASPQPQSMTQGSAS